MNSLLDDDEEDLTRERELTLSTGVIVGIFLVLVLLCGAFFGFGYKMGSHKAVIPVAADTTDGAPQPSSDTFGGFKPSAGSPAGSNAAQPTAETGGSGEIPTAPVAESPAPKPAARAAATPVVATPEAPVATGTYVVQVAAVSHEEDAQLLVTALKAKGYPVSAHTVSTDKFYHIQVGPFTNMKDAAAAKAQLISDGYQPIIK